MTSKYEFSGNVQAGAIGDYSNGTINQDRNIQIKTVEDFKASLENLISELRADPEIDFDVLTSINFFKEHANCQDQPQDATRHWDKLKHSGKKICGKLHEIGLNVSSSCIAAWIIEGLNSLL